MTGDDILSHVYAMDMNYDSIQKYAQIYLDSFPNDSRFGKRYARWSQFWQQRIDKSGDFGITYSNMLSLDKNACSGNGNWSQTGPVIDNDQVSGIITCIAVSPHNSDVIFAGSNTGGLWRTTDGGASWQNVTDSKGVPGLGINDVIIHPQDPDVIYIATGYNYIFVPQNYGIGVLKSINGGDTWENTSLSWDANYANTLGSVNMLAFHPNNSNIIYALGKEEVYEMTYTGNDPKSLSSNHIILNGLHNINGSGSSRAEYIDIDFLPNVISPSGYEIFVSTRKTRSNGSTVFGNVFSSNNDGQSWSAINIPDVNSDGGNTKLEVAVIETAPDDNTATNKLYVYWGYSNGGSATDRRPLAYFNNSTNSWGTTLNYNLTYPSTAGSNSGLEKDFLGFEVNSKNSQVMYFPSQIMRKSQDEGQSVVNITSYNTNNTHADVRDIDFISTDINSLSTNGNGTGISNEDIIVIGTDGGVGKNVFPNGNMTWQILNGTGDKSNRLIATQFFDITVSSKHSGLLIGGAQDNGTFKYIYNNWYQQNNGDGGQGTISDENTSIITRGNEKLQIESNYDGNLISLGTAAFHTLFSDDPFYDYSEVEMHRTDNNKVYFAKFNRFIQRGPFINPIQLGSLTNYIDYDFGDPNTFDIPDATWIKISTFESSPQSPDKMLLAFDQSANYNGLVYASPRFFESNDGGQSWQNISNNVIIGTGDQPLHGASITGIAFNPADDQEIWMSIGNWKSDSNDDDIGIFRVIYSDNGGVSWSDKSTGLSSAPVNDIIYQEGSNDILYAATDIGIYKYNASLNEWECFNDGLPVSIINDLEIDYCQGKLYASAFGRGIWESPISEYEQRIEITNSNNNNGLWENEDREIRNTLVIKSGTQLEMKNCNYRIGVGKSIIVEPGALLILNNTTLTSECGMWDGIIVQGDATASQSGHFPNCAQGMLKVENGSVIEFANDGVRLWDPIDGGGLSKAGGIIHAVNSTFRNNRRDVEFMKYQNMAYLPSVGTFPVKNRSTFRMCNFIINDDLKQHLFVFDNNNNLDDRVTIWDYDGVWFAGCSFEINFIGSTGNNIPWIDDSEIAGIYSIDAEYDVEGYCNGLTMTCPNPIPSTFHNFHYGIHATSSSGYNRIRVRNSVFTRNVYGIATQGMNGIEITKNSFNIGRGQGGFIGGQYGISVNTGIGYEIQENVFNGFDLNDDPSLPPAPVPNTIGVYIQNTGDTENKVRRNSYNILNFANMAYGKNRNLTTQTAGESGLQFLCSNYSHNFSSTPYNLYDNFVWGISWFPNPSNPIGIRGEQGIYNPFQQAGLGDGNRFTTNPQPQGNYFVTDNVEAVQRYYKSNVGSNALFVTSKVSQDPVIDEACLSELNDDGTIYIGVGIVAGKNAVIGEFEAHENDFLTTVYLYDNLIDGGNTAAMSNNVQFNWSTDAWTLRDELIAESPNLSQEVLLDAAYTGILPDALLMEVLMANPNSLEGEDFFKTLEYEIPNPLPTSMIDILRVIPEPASLRTDLEHQMSYHNYKKTMAGHLLIKNILNDSIPNRDSLNYWLDRMNTLHTQYALAESYLVSGQESQGQTLINGLNTQYPYAEHFDADYQAYVQMYGLKAQIYQSDRTWMDITQSEKAQLQTIAYNTNAEAAIQARNILCFFYDECVPPNAGVPNNTTPGRIINIQNPQLELTKQLTEVQVYPNPARDYVTFEYHLPEYLEHTQLSVTDVTGKVIHTTNLAGYEGQYLWDTRPIKNGFYFYVLKNNKGENIASGKLAIAK